MCKEKKEKKLPEFVGRMEKELDELIVKQSKLTDFLCSQEGKNLSQAERFMLDRQSCIMDEYTEILEARISLYKDSPFA